jgi:hypothetical protein
MSEYLRRMARVAGCAISIVWVAGCSTGQVGVGPSATVASSSNFTLKFAVGTATIATTTGSSIGLNTVATFRQSDGQNATAANTPTLSAPTSFPASLGGMRSITGITPGQLSGGAALVQSGGKYQPPVDAVFGTAMGVFGYGFAQLNLVDIATLTAAFPTGFFGFDGCANHLDGTGQTVNGAAQGFEYSAMPLAASPCLGLGAFGVTQQPYYGGPPAWPSPQGYGLPTGFIGYPLGFADYYGVAPAAGTYALDVAYSINGNATAYAHVDATAKLTMTTPLPVFPAPSVAPQNDGSALVTVSVPVGVTEAIVLINDDACQLDTSGTTNQRYFSVLTRQAGPQTLLVSSKLGPPDASGNPTDTFCTAADDALPNASTNHRFTVAAVGFDYPAFEASYPQSTTPSPVISNATGQADLTTSVPTGVGYKLSAP